MGAGTNECILAANSSKACMGGFKQLPILMHTL